MHVGAYFTTWLVFLVYIHMCHILTGVDAYTEKSFVCIRIIKIGGGGGIYTEMGTYFEENTVHSIAWRRQTLENSTWKIVEAALLRYTPLTAVMLFHIIVVNDQKCK